MSFSISAIPDIRFGDGALSDLPAAVKSFDGVGAVLLVIDAFLAQSGLAGKISAELAEAGVMTQVFSDFSGEPKLAHLQAAIQVAEGADMVIGIGGGSALDIAKIVACCAASGEDPMHYALAANPLPKNPLKKIMVPTTAGTGSETSATNIFAGPEGKKLWIWGPETKADLVILDAALTKTLPANLTAWCGLDAFIHAFEAATNRNTHRGAQFYAHQALRLITGALETAVKQPDDIAPVAMCCSGPALPASPSTIAARRSPIMSAMRWRVWRPSIMVLRPRSASRRRSAGSSKPIHQS